MKATETLLIATIFILLCSIPGIVSGQTTEKATFAGGCYWCMEDAFEHVDGIVAVISGFTANVEAVEVEYDPAKTPYAQLLEVFWKNIDPMDAEGQFCDRGARYRSAIFYHTQGQKTAAETSRTEIQTKLNHEIATPVLQAVPFKPVPESEQDYFKKKPYDYKQYKIRCGRDRRLRSIWKEAK